MINRRASCICYFHPWGRVHECGLYLTPKCLVHPFTVESAVSDGQTVMWDEIWMYFLTFLCTLYLPRQPVVKLVNLFTNCPVWFLSPLLHFFYRVEDILSKRGGAKRFEVHSLWEGKRATRWVFLFLTSFSFGFVSPVEFSLAPPQDTAVRLQLVKQVHWWHTCK